MKKYTKKYTADDLRDDYAMLLYKTLNNREKKMTKKVVKNKKEEPKTTLECGGKSFDLAYYLDKKGKPLFSYVSWDELQERMGKRLYKKFCVWMNHQTCCDKGVYECDVENFFRPTHKQFWD